MRARWVILACLSALPAVVAAQSGGGNEARLRDALRTATNQVRALEDEKARLQASEAELKRKLESVEGQLAAAQKTVVKPTRCPDHRGELQEQVEARAKATLALRECEARVGVAESARAQEAERSKQVGSDVATLEEKLARAYERNARMYAVGKGIIDWLEGVGVASAIAAREPFLGLKRVELENAAQDHLDRLAEQRVKP
jgi:hypothetical protein